jgi:hypothetical protein
MGVPSSGPIRQVEVWAFITCIVLISALTLAGLGWVLCGCAAYGDERGRVDGWVSVAA